MADDILPQKTKVVQISLAIPTHEIRQDLEKLGIEDTQENIKIVEKMSNIIINKVSYVASSTNNRLIKEEVKKRL